VDAELLAKVLHENRRPGEGLPGALPWEQVAPGWREVFVQHAREVIEAYKRETAEALPLVCGCGARRAGRGAEGRFGCPICNEPFAELPASDAERPDPATAASAGELRLPQHLARAAAAVAGWRFEDETPTSLALAVHEAAEALRVEPEQVEVVVRARTPRMVPPAPQLREPDVQHFAAWLRSWAPWDAVAQFERANPETAR
jgi:hypothetical protein